MAIYYGTLKGREKNMVHFKDMVLMEKLFYGPIEE